MLSYFLAVGAAWLAASVISSIGHIGVLGTTYKSMQDKLLEEETGKRRMPFYFLGRLVFAFIFVYLLQVVAPVDSTWLTGLRYGALVGLIIYMPRAFDEFASFPYPFKMIIAGALIGVNEASAAGVVAVLIL